MVQGMAYVTVNGQIFNSTYIQGFKKKKKKAKGVCFSSGQPEYMNKNCNNDKNNLSKKLKVRIHQGQALDAVKGSTGELKQIKV